MERYTSASDMRFKKDRVKGQGSRGFVIQQCLFLLITCYLLLAACYCYAELIDRVVAFVDEKAITLSEFNEAYKSAKKGVTDISKDEVLNTMINRILLLNEAKKMKIETKTEEDAINEYIEWKVRAFIRLREEDLENYYNQNSSEFGNVSYDDIRDKIEEFLVEKEINRLLKRHISELRSKAYIRVLNHEER